MKGDYNAYDRDIAVLNVFYGTEVATGVTLGKKYCNQC